MVMDLSKSKLSVVENKADYGLYVWRLPNGKLFMDDSGNVLNIPSTRYDFNKMAIITRTAAEYGQPDGEPYFMAGVGRATEEEYQEDLDRINNGLLPLGDLGAWQDAARARQQHNQ